MEFETLHLNVLTWLSAKSALLMFLPLLWLYWYRRPNSRFPPGPRGVPILGAIPYLSKYPAKDFKRWSLEKGEPVISVRLGREETVVLNTFDSINQCFVKNSSKSSGRPYNEVFNIVKQGKGFVNLDYGEVFKAQRNFGLKCLKNKGLGKKLLENEVNAEGDIFVEYIKEIKGPVNFKKYLYFATANVISKTALGKRYQYDDPDFQKLLLTMGHLFSHPNDSPKVALLSRFYSLRFFSSFSAALHRHSERMKLLFDVMQQNIEEHRRNLDEHNPGDYIDAFLVEQKTGQNSKERGFTDHQLAIACLDLFIAGSETSSTTLCWLFVYFLNFPKYRELIENETLEVLGLSGLPTMEKRIDMPVTCAFIQEVMRIKTIAPLGVPHKSTASIEIDGYVIPKETKIYSNLHGAHMDPDTWPNPERFDPHRHIDENGKFVPSNKIIPFSIGSRFCLGESLGRVEIFVFFVKIVQKFNVRCPNEDRLPPIDEEIISSSLVTPLECILSLSSRK